MTKPEAVYVGPCRLVIAVGLDQKAVIVEVVAGPNCLVEDGRKWDAEVVLWPTVLPSGPGMYEFTGSAFLEYFPDGFGQFEQDHVYRGEFRRLHSATP